MVKLLLFTCDALRDLVPFLQFKKRENTHGAVLLAGFRRHWRLSGAFIVNFEHLSYLILMFLLLSLSR